MLVKITALDPSCASYTTEEISAIRARNFKHMLDLFAQGNISTFATRFGLNRTVISLLVNQRSLFTDSYVRKFTQRMDFAVNTFDCPSSYDFFVRTLRQINSFEGIFLSCVPEEIRQHMANGEELEEIGINTVYPATQRTTTDHLSLLEQPIVTVAELTTPTARRGRPSRTSQQAEPQEPSFIARSQLLEPTTEIPKEQSKTASEVQGATFHLEQARLELQDTILVPRNTNLLTPNLKSDSLGVNSTKTLTTNKNHHTPNGEQDLANRQTQASLFASEQQDSHVNPTYYQDSPIPNIYGGIFIQPLAKEFTGRLFYHGNDYSNRSIAELEQLGLQFAARVEAKKVTQQSSTEEVTGNLNNNLDYISSTPIFLSEHDYWNFFGRVTHYNQHIHSQLATIRVLSEANLPELNPFQNCIVRLINRFSKAGYYLFRYNEQLYLRHLSILADKLYCYASNNAFESFLVAHNEIRIIGRVVIALDYKTLG